MNLPLIKVKAKVRGLFSGSIPYNPLIENGDSSPYFGTFETQRIGRYETSCCWDFSACEVLETRLGILLKLGLIPKETLDWLQKSGYIDSNGDFYISRRWVAILSGVKDSGNDPIHFWEIASVAGVIPNSMLPYDHTIASKWISQNQFNNDYFNPQVITIEMELMGKEFVKRFKILAENIWGGNFDRIQVMIQTYLKEGSLQISHPVPHDGSWNQQFVNNPVGNQHADHATELYKFDPTQKYPFYDYDSYEPHLKQLAKDYFITLITRVSILPKPTFSTVQITTWQKFWANAFAWLKGLVLPYPEVQIGRA